MAMIKTVERYDKKLPDLKGLIEDYIAGTVKVKIKIRFWYLSRVMQKGPLG